MECPAIYISSLLQPRSKSMNTMRRHYTGIVIIPAVVLMLLLPPPLSAGAAARAPIMGMPGCETTCGHMDVPYPFGMGPARCYWPGFNLTCDRSIGKESPRLLLGDGTLEVDYILSVDSAQIAVRTPGDIKVAADGRGSPWGGLGDDGPFSLDLSLTELTLTGCTVRVALKNGNVTMDSCSSLCVSGDEPSNMWSCSGVGCCQADIVINREVVAGNKLVSITSYDVELDYLGWNHTVDHKWPARVFVAERGWFGLQKQSQEGLVRTQVPILLEWEVILAAAMPDRDASSPECPRDAVRKVSRSKHSYCDKGDRGGYRCRCKEGYDGNPFVPHGCQGYACADIDECKDPLKRLCYGDCTNTMGSFDCRCPLGTRGDPDVPGGCFSPLAGFKNVSARTLPAASSPTRLQATSQLQPPALPSASSSGATPSSAPGRAQAAPSSSQAAPRPRPKPHPKPRPGPRPKPRPKPRPGRALQLLLLQRLLLLRILAMVMADLNFSPPEEKVPENQQVEDDQLNANDGNADPEYDYAVDDQFPSAELSDDGTADAGGFEAGYYVELDADELFGGPRQESCAFWV